MKRKLQEKNKDKIKARFAEKFGYKILKGNLIIWSKYKWNIEK